MNIGEKNENEKNKFNRLKPRSAIYFAKGKKWSFEQNSLYRNKFIKMIDCDIIKKVTIIF